MAFVYKTGRSKSVPRITPAPGQYLGQPEYNLEPNRVPFLSKATRIPEKAPLTERQTPNLYLMAKNLLKLGSFSQVSLTLTQDIKQQSDSVRPSSNFQSKIERFENKKEKKDHLGPGAYYKEPVVSKVNNKPPPKADMDSHRQYIRNLLRKQNVPSIPSQIHSHGYSETKDGRLVLNEQPIEEVQEIPGNRMHDLNDPVDFKRNQVEPWSKTLGTNRMTYIPKKATIDLLGPGTYNVEEKELSIKNRPSANFVSKIDRATTIKPRRSQSTGRSSFRAMPLKGLFDREELIDDENDDEEEEEEYVRDATPGPGHYYNQSTASSFNSRFTKIRRGSDGEIDEKNVTFRVPQKRIMGSCTERFRIPTPPTADIGPGAYKVNNNFLKKDTVKVQHKLVPFQTSNDRFKGTKSLETPGPGAYIKSGKGNKGKKGKGPPANFGNSTDRELFPNLKEEAEAPGPADYDPKTKLEIGNIFPEELKGTYTFMSKIKRDKEANEEGAPPVGAYDIKNFDIATKVIKEEDDIEISPKKPPFNSANPRFKEKKIIENDDNDDEVNWTSKNKLDNVIRAQKLLKPSAIFVSRTKKQVSENLVPGPGSYHNSTQNSWARPTFNINFHVG